MPQKNRTAMSRTQRLIAGIQKHLAGVSSLMIASANYTPGDLTSQLQALVDLYADVFAAEAALKAKLAARTERAPDLVAFQADFVDWVKAGYGKSPDVLADFGLTPKKKRTPLSTEQSLLAVARRAATRKKRGTMGKKAKRALKGDVTGLVVTPVGRAGAAEAPPAPAPDAPKDE